MFQSVYWIIFTVLNNYISLKKTGQSVIRQLVSKIIANYTLAPFTESIFVISFVLISQTISML